MPDSSIRLIASPADSSGPAVTSLTRITPPICMGRPYKSGLKSAAAATVNQVNDMPTPETSFDTVQLADRLRPVLLRVGRELRREAREVGVSPQQVTLMVAIKYEPGIGIRELAAREKVSAPAMTKHVDRLERDGYVTRTQSESDKRRVGLTLTEEGARVLRRVRSRRTAWLATRLRGLTPDQLAAVEAAIDPLSELL
jgi:DNA-binding MarR family transcriptional regulator